jgi:DNA modification methylase
MIASKKTEHARPIHPFPARMAPDLALAQLKKLPPSSVVLDPMVGSGTVVRQASDLGHRAIGVDSDPLAVLMSTVWTRPVRDQLVESVLVGVLAEARKLRVEDIHLPWIDDDPETAGFVKYWFGRKQRNALRCLAFALWSIEDGRRASAARAANDVLRLALSRIIITKDHGASLARDVSHSRPHRVANTSQFDVMAAFERSASYVRRQLASHPPGARADVRLGDARCMNRIDAHSIDAVLTSPPYLNAIDYMRGHRLSLVWLGHSVRDLREIRGQSVGSERGIENAADGRGQARIEQAMGDLDALSPRHKAMVHRYAQDIGRFVSEVARVLKPGGQATFVVGNSCLKDTFIHNASAVAAAAKAVGLTAKKTFERELPDRHRYLPMPSDARKPLGKRMRTETILTFAG